MSDARLDEFDKEEWRLIVRSARIMDGNEPHSDEEFDRLWDEFIAEKEERARRRLLS